jgi:predicted glycoside hydrolase/deacetylase ChbG (UPF0249 family)
MDEMMEREENEANELLDETQRLRHKRDLLTKENEQLKSYLRLRQMESTATCEQLKSEIEQQIEQFEALGDTQTNHLETLKSFRSEIEAIQTWNQKIRNKYFSRNNLFNFHTNHNTDEDEAQLRSHQNNTSCSQLTNQDLFTQSNRKESISKPIHKNDKQIDSNITSNSTKTNLRKSKNESIDKNENSYKIITRSQQKLITNSRKRKTINSSEDIVDKNSKRKKK